MCFSTNQLSEKYASLFTNEISDWLRACWIGTKISKCAVLKFNNFVNFQAVKLACLSNLKKAENEYRQVVSLKTVWKTNHRINFKTVKQNNWRPLKRPGWNLGCEAVLIQQRAASNQTSYLELVYLVTALVPSLTACLANSPGNSNRTAVWISRLEMVARLL